MTWRLRDPRVDKGTPQTPDTISHFLKSLERPSRSLKPWELSFLASIGDQFERNGRLSDKQFEKLEQIYVDATD